MIQMPLPAYSAVNWGSVSSYRGVAGPQPCLCSPTCNLQLGLKALAMLTTSSALWRGTSFVISQAVYESSSAIITASTASQARAELLFIVLPLILC